MIALPVSAGRPRLAAIDWAMLETAMALGDEKRTAEEREINLEQQEPLKESLNS